MSGVRVASFNVRNGLACDRKHAWWFRRRATLAAIERLDADIVGLQEAHRFQLRWIVRHLPDMATVGAGRSRRRRGEHAAVLVRATRLVVTDVTTRWFGATPDVAGSRLAGARTSRIATTAQLRLPSGETLSFTNTHLDERSAERRDESAAQLVTWLGVDGAPQIVVGDLNATPQSAVVTRLVDAGFARVDTGPSGTVHQFTGRTDGRILDHILVRGGVDVVAAGVSHQRPFGTLPSDHWPIWADVDLHR